MNNKGKRKELVQRFKPANSLFQPVSLDRLATRIASLSRCQGLFLYKSLSILYLTLIPTSSLATQI